MLNFPKQQIAYKCDTSWIMDSNLSKRLKISKFITGKQKTKCPPNNSKQARAKAGDPGESQDRDTQQRLFAVLLLNVGVHHTAFSGPKELTGALERAGWSRKPLNRSDDDDIHRRRQSVAAAVLTL